MTDRTRVVLIALVAALPSVIWGLWGGGFLTDDWAVWFVFERNGVLDGMRELAFEQPARPLAAPYYAFIYLVIGDVPVLQGLLIATINGLVICAAWWVGKEVLPSNVLWPTLIVLALMPNHATTRYWFVVGTYPLALALILCALGLLLRRQPLVAALLFVASTLLYEGAVVFGLAAAALWTTVDLKDRAQDGVIVAVPTVVVAATSFLLSPKRGDGSGPDIFQNAGTFIPGQFIRGLWGHPAVAAVGGMVILLMIMVAVTRQLPSFRSKRPEYRWILIGAAFCVFGAVPYFVSGSIFATSGIFDRNNLVPGVGVALILGSIMSVLDQRSARVATALGMVVCFWFSYLIVDDLQSFASAVDDGETLIASLAGTGLNGTNGRQLLVVPAQPSREGMANFIYSNDLVAAMTFRSGGDWSGLMLVERADCELIDANQNSINTFDWERGVIEDVNVERLPDSVKSGWHECR